MNYINPYKLFHGAFIPNWLLEMVGLSAGAKITYGRLCQFADKDTGVAWPSMDVLAKSIGVSDRQCRDYVKELEGAGLIENKRLGLGHSNQYRFLESQHFGAMTSDPERNTCSDQERNDCSDQERNDCSDHMYKDRKESKEKNQSIRGKKSKPTPTGADQKVKTGPRPKSLEEVLEYAKVRRIPAGEAEKFYDHWQTTGWKRGKDAKIPIMDWQACFRTWERNYLERGGMRTPGNFKGISTLEYIEMMEAKHGKVEPLPPLPDDWDKHLRGFGEGHVG